MVLLPFLCHRQLLSSLSSTMRHVFRNNFSYNVNAVKAHVAVYREVTDLNDISLSTFESVVKRAFSL